MSTTTTPRRRSRPAAPATALAYTERVNRTIDHIVTHLADPLSLAALARVAHLSPFHFHRVFQGIVGETPGDFVKRLRLERALALMALPAPRRLRSMSSIADACGFSSVSDFSRSFRGRYGASPSKFDVDRWRHEHRAELEALTLAAAGPHPAAHHVRALPPRDNPDNFRVRIRDLPARTVAYIRVLNPYRGHAVVRAVERLVTWAEGHGVADNQWLGYQWENPELVDLKDCQYFAAVEAGRFTPAGEVGRFRFPPMVVAQIEIRGPLDLELRALQWFYSVWLPRSGYVPDDHPGFEAWKGRPFGHGFEHFEIDLQLPVRRA